MWLNLTSILKNLEALSFFWVVKAQWNEMKVALKDKTLNTTEFLTLTGVLYSIVDIKFKIDQCALPLAR